MRIHDNEALFNAANSKLPVIGIYVFDDTEFRKTGFGFDSMASHRLNFILESLEDLKKNLEKLNIPLLVYKGDTADIIPKLDLDISAIYYHDEGAFFEKNIENKLKSRMKKTEFYGFYGRNLFHPDDIPYEKNAVPSVFTAFKKKTENRTSVRAVFPDIKIQDKVVLDIEKNEIPRIEEFGFPKYKRDKRASSDFYGVETQALKELDYYFFETKLVLTYKETRNGLTGRDFSSKLSPYLARGCISPRYVYKKLKEFEDIEGSNDSTYWLFFELMWRDYFYFVNEMYPIKMYSKYGIRGVDFSWDYNKEYMDKWICGETGFELVDASMNELKATGFMSNRNRQIASSFLTKNLNIDWRFGAEYFESMLIDFDVYSNYGNWQYGAGVGNDPRSFRYFSVEIQEKKFDKDRSFRELWLEKDYNLDKIVDFKESISKNKEKYKRAFNTL